MLLQLQVYPFQINIIQVYALAASKNYDIVKYPESN